MPVLSVSIRVWGDEPSMNRTESIVVASREDALEVSWREHGVFVRQLRDLQSKRRMHIFEEAIGHSVHASF